MHRVDPTMTTRARALRTGATDAERLLWRMLSRYRPKFTRQLVIGRYIADLACREAKLIVEVDGSQHADNTEQDQVRTMWLEQQGWTVLRFWNNEVLSNSAGVAETILRRAAECLGGTHPQHISPPLGSCRGHDPAG